jgi:hypothetical protein
VLRRVLPIADDSPSRWASVPRTGSLDFGIRRLRPEDRRVRGAAADDPRVCGAGFMLGAGKVSRRFAQPFGRRRRLRR